MSTCITIQSRLLLAASVVSSALLAMIVPASMARSQAVMTAETVSGAVGNNNVDSDLIERTWTINGENRIALIHVPASANPDAAAKDKSIKLSPAPVVFAFHGHMGTARQASRSFHMHTEWPEAIVVYMQGLPTPGSLTDHAGHFNGWQSKEGDENDRDLKFFDAVLETVRHDYKVDESRIYAMGHSNGGGFTYLLWQTRPDIFAAFAPSGAFTLKVHDLKPKPVMHIAGRNDPLVKFRWQERCIEVVKKIDNCTNVEGESNWDGCKDCTYYKSADDNKTPVVTLFYNGTHTYPTDEAPAMIVKFFKEEVKPGDSTSPKQ